MLFFTLDLAFLMLGLGYLQNSSGAPQAGCIKAGGVFGLLAAFLAWFVLPKPLRVYQHLLESQVQCPRRYRRPEQLVLPHSRCALPMVRQGT